MTGVSARHIRAIETGRIAQPRPVTVRLLADAFGLCGADRDRFQQLVVAAAEQVWVSRSAADRTVPAQLPADVPDFTGRIDELDRLDTIASGAGEHPVAVLISALAGTAGVGKPKPGS